LERVELGELQDLVLERVLQGTPLPGRETAISFPDLAYVTRADEALVIAEGYEGRSARVTVVGDDELRRRSESGETAFIQFQPATETENGVTLRARVLLQFPDVDPLPLGELVVTFARRGESWMTVDPTHAVAF
jgi:hypothetical protein